MPPYYWTRFPLQRAVVWTFIGALSFAVARNVILRTTGIDVFSELPLVRAFVGAAVMPAIVVGLFLLCWLPYQMANWSHRLSWSPIGPPRGSHWTGWFVCLAEVLVMLILWWISMAQPLMIHAGWTRTWLAHGAIELAWRHHGPAFSIYEDLKYHRDVPPGAMSGLQSFEDYVVIGSFPRNGDRLSYPSRYQESSVKTGEARRWELGLIRPALLSFAYNLGQRTIYTVVVPLWLLLLLSIGALNVDLILSRAEMGRQRLCAHCSYDLRGNRSGVCPECGTSIPEKQRDVIAKSTST